MKHLVTALDIIGSVLCIAWVWGYPAFSSPIAAPIIITLYLIGGRMLSIANRYEP